MSLPKEIYVWDEEPEGKKRCLNIEADGKRPTNENLPADRPLRAGVYQLVREVEISQDVKEVPIRQALAVGFTRELK